MRLPLFPGSQGKARCLRSKRPRLLREMDRPRPAPRASAPRPRGRAGLAAPGAQRSRDPVLAGPSRQAQPLTAACHLGLAVRVAQRWLPATGAPAAPAAASLPEPCPFLRSPVPLRSARARSGGWGTARLCAGGAAGRGPERQPSVGTPAPCVRLEKQHWEGFV